MGRYVRSSIMKNGRKSDFTSCAPLFVVETTSQGSQIPIAALSSIMSMAGLIILVSWSNRGVISISTIDNHLGPNFEGWPLDCCGG
ncbi:hypothetical protein ES703_08281 [subsurface metagenome]